MQIYIVKTNMSSSNHIQDSSELDDYRRMETFTFNKQTRLDISAIRSRYKKPIYDNCANFHGLYLCKDEDVEGIQKLITEADEKLREIDYHLGASILFIPLDSAAIKTGEMYENICSAIKSQIFTTLLNRIETVSHTAIPTRSKQSLLKMVKRMERINVMDDPDITYRLNNIRDQIMKEAIAPLQEQLGKELKILTSRGANLEL
jgi:hypothetical protein